MQISEIFYSLQGESTFMGMPCVFIRLSGCNLRCSYCDTGYASEKMVSMTLEEVLKDTLKYSCDLVEITGGEPLLQPEVPSLTEYLSKHNKTVLVETNGSMDIRCLKPPVIRIIDIKCPASGESDKMKWENIQHLRESDEIKFVISDRRDFEWAVVVMNRYHLAASAKILFSPVYAVLEPALLADWILGMNLRVRLQIQLHKYISVK